MTKDTRYRKGHVPSEEVRQKISNANKGRKFTAETIAKRVEARKGYKHSAETREKIRLANTGNSPSEETRLKMGEIHKGQIPWNKGMKFSTLTRNDISRNWVAKNKTKKLEHSRRSHLKRKYGITLEEYERLLSVQSGRCAICQLTTEGKNLRIDHCHKTGKIRGLLCHTCNTGLGHFKDSINLLEEAKIYLIQAS